MTVFLRALYGPFGRSEDRVGQAVVNPPHGWVRQVDWHFFGIREDNSMGRWCVRFKVREREWSAFALPMAEAIKVGGKWEKPLLDPAFVDAYVPDKPMLYGRTYLDILKPRLSKEDIAFAARLAMKAVR
ncbi:MULTISPECIES: hypothetical protein [Phyllobacteriaceae]|jgi:hypothetical protein|uniref:Uncharacterized protein n=1 Tax=Mesorhizobium hungaricum TaxID=1566387 RepID=A0A1C2DDD7_9HYPH|nr:MULTISPECIES: hypothetical protein [Mesorhizobium]MBN9235126.1 hypothetical protein [Mesorhizobium sp.]OCX12675.1 hypothetical protein QV13_24060 [Mesorhizobium hungaricum]